MESLAERRSRRELDEMLELLDEILPRQPINPVAYLALGEVRASWRERVTERTFNKNAALAAFDRFLSLTSDENLRRRAEWVREWDVDVLNADLRKFMGRDQKDELAAVRAKVLNWRMDIEKGRPVYVLTPLADLQGHSDSLAGKCDRTRDKIAKNEKDRDWWLRSRRVDRFATARTIKKDIDKLEKELAALEAEQGRVSSAIAEAAR
jgi:hypothetical protein